MEAYFSFPYETTDSPKSSKVKLKSLSRDQPFVTPWTSSLTGSSLHGILQARVLEWGAIAFSGFKYRLFQIYLTYRFLSETVIKIDLRIVSKQHKCIFYRKGIWDPEAKQLVPGHIIASDPEKQ